MRLRIRKPVKLLRRLRSSVRRSLQHRVIATIALLALVVAFGFSVVSVVSVRTSLLDQASTQTQRDFAEEVGRAQTGLDSSDVTSRSEYQQLVTELASTLQTEGGSNLLGIYIVGSDADYTSLVPVSTDPNYLPLVSDSMRSQVSASRSTDIFYQSVGYEDDGRQDIPGAVLGSSLTLPNGERASLFAAYSYEAQQRSVLSIQFTLLVSCVVLSVLMALIAWKILRDIIRPVESVAVAAERLASGDRSARVTVNRVDEIGVLQRSFNEMADSLNETIEELETVSSMQRRFVSDVSHELRTPVTTIRMASDLLESRKNDFDPITARTVELLSDQTGRFQQMLADLLEISRYDAGSESADFMDTDVRMPVNSAMDDVAGIARAKGVVISAILGDAPVTARIDLRRIDRVVRNLLGNAVDFAEDGPVEVRMALNDTAVVISVRDYGTGIDPEDLTHIFDRFWRADTSRSRITGGTGLGLSIAQQDTKLHHGRLEVRSRVGAGTWFLLTLPVGGDAEPRAEDCPVRFSDESSLAVIGRFLNGKERLISRDGEKGVNNA